VLGPSLEEPQPRGGEGELAEENPSRLHRHWTEFSRSGKPENPSRLHRHSLIEIINRFN